VPLRGSSPEVPVITIVLQEEDQEYRKGVDRCSRAEANIDREQSERWARLLSAEVWVAEEVRPPYVIQRSLEVQSANTGAPAVPADAVEKTPLFSLRENAIAREPGSRYAGAGGVCFDSALHWWLRLHRAFPAEDPEPGSVFGLITGDPDPRGYFPRSRGSRL